MKKVLLIEDDQVHTDVVAFLFGEELPSVRLYCAGTIAEGCDVLDSEDIDLLILDLLLPDGSGLDVIRKVNAENKIFIIVLSAAEELHREASLIDVDAFVTKPIRHDELVPLIKSMLIDYE